ncbi:MAG TPA: NIPSNAP family protein, partial [Verrucomicrobiales bacterium]|nr:NIPSNAP family protein [Verrucomicrobiales bacterium]
FEMRTYTTPPGKLEALHARFKNHTMALFSKHGMNHVAYWVPAAGQKDEGTKLVYILSHASPEAGLASFTAFRADPAWIKAKGESEKDGSLTLPQPDGVKSIYMRATDFSPIR